MSDETSTLPELPEFLLARIAEDEAAAALIRATKRERQSPWTSSRVLAECEAKRRIVEMYAAAHLAGIALRDVDIQGQTIAQSANVGIESVLKILAVVYADHPDYQQEWRP